MVTSGMHAAQKRQCGSGGNSISDLNFKLIGAIQAGRIDAVRSCIEQGASVDSAISRNGFTARVLSWDLYCKSHVDLCIEAYRHYGMPCIGYRSLETLKFTLLIDIESRRKKVADFVASQPPYSHRLRIA